MIALRGAIVWCVAPFVPTAPFRMYAGPRKDPYEVGSANGLLRAAAQGGDVQHSMVAQVKLRPVLVLTEPDAHLSEISVLRLVRLEKLPDTTRRQVRDQKHPRLFHLAADRTGSKQGIENAVDIAALLRIHASAIAGSPVGRLNDNEMRVIAERLGGQLQLDLTMLVSRAARERLKDLPQTPP